MKSSRGKKMLANLAIKRSIDLAAIKIDKRKAKYDLIRARLIEFSHSYVSQAVTDHAHMRAITTGDFSAVPPGICTHTMCGDIPMEMIFPIMDFLHPAISNILRATFEESKSKPSYQLTDLEFVCNVSYKRDWFDDCPICFESMFCKTCTHRHAVIFRPCSHAMCASCAEKFTDCPTCKSPIEYKFESPDDIYITQSIKDIIDEKLPEVVEQCRRIKKIWKAFPTKKISLMDLINAQFKVTFTGSMFRCVDYKAEAN